MVKAKPKSKPKISYGRVKELSARAGGELVGKLTAHELNCASDRLYEKIITDAGTVAEYCGRKTLLIGDTRYAIRFNKITFLG